MKKHYILFLSVIALISCSKEPFESQAPVTDQKKFTVSFTDNIVKTSLENLNVNWVSEDAIAVFTPDGTKAKFTVDASTINGGSAVFTGFIKDADSYVAIYPYDAADSYDGTYITFSQANDQTAVKDNFANGSNVAVASTTDAHFSFKNVTTLLKVNLKYSGVRSIVVTSTGPSIAGSFKVKPSGESISEVSGTNTVTLTSSSNLGVGLYYIPVPYSETTVTDLTVSLKNSSSVELSSFSFTKGFKYQRNRICNLGDFGLGISCAQDMIDLAAAVNSGASTEKWESSAGCITVLRDIDMSAVDNWTPIGYATISGMSSSTPIAVSDGYAFTKTFDGNGHTVKGLKMTAPSGLSAIKPYGLFGTVADGGIVKNINFDSDCSLTVNASYATAAGVLAGMVCASDVRTVTSYASITFAPQVTATTAIYSGLVGACWGGATRGFLIDSCHNYGAITAATDGHANASFGSYSVGGLVGMAESGTSNGTGTPMSNISDSSNEADITTSIYRTGGCVGTLSNKTSLTNLTNSGNITCTAPNVARVGGITSIVSSWCTMANCQNTGDIICTNSASAGGLMANVSAGGRSFVSCSNYGIIISDSANRGSLFGYTGTNSSVTTFYTGCTCAGFVGTYNGGDYQFDSYYDVYKYLGHDAGIETLTIKNMTYKMGCTDPANSGDANFRILYIGNSFSQDACHLLGGILTGAGINDVLVVQMYYGGRTLQEYNEYWNESDYTKHTIAPGSAEVVNTLSSTLSTVVASEQWDVVCIQEHTGTHFAWIWTDAEKNAIQSIIDKVKATQNSPPKFYYLMSQAYYDLSNITINSKSYGPGGAQELFTDRQGMYATICTQAQTVMNEISDFTGIVATGTALENLRTTSCMTSHPLGLTRDGYHLDYGLGLYCAACVSYQTFIYPRYKKSLDSNTYRNATTNNLTGFHRTAITDTNAPIAQRAAIEAVNHPYQVTDLSYL